MTPTGLIIIPFIDCWDDTLVAVMDAAQQLAGTVDILLIDQGSSTGPKEAAEQLVRTYQATHFLAKGSLRLWRHAPPMASLSATWNTALDYAWELGHADAMVWNNDVRVGSWMYEALRHVAWTRDLWFTTPVNCRDGAPESWKMPAPLTSDLEQVTLGGPDFSCFLISRECHAKYRFDERFQPAYHEDGDMHRRQWLGGDGRKIAGVTLPYLHYGSKTIKRSREAESAFSPLFEACRRRYVQKWGGAPHGERKLVPDSDDDFDGVGTPGGYLIQLPPYREVADGRD